MVDVILVVNVTCPCWNHHFFLVENGAGPLLKPTFDISVPAAVILLLVCQLWGYKLPPISLP